MSMKEKEGQRTSKEEDKEGNSGYFCRVVVGNEETELSVEEHPCHVGKDKTKEGCVVQGIDLLPSQY